VAQVSSSLDCCAFLQAGDLEGRNLPATLTCHSGRTGWATNRSAVRHHLLVVSMGGASSSTSAATASGGDTSQDWNSLKNKSNSKLMTKADTSASVVPAGGEPGAVHDEGDSGLTADGVVRKILKGTALALHTASDMFALCYPAALLMEEIYQGYCAIKDKTEWMAEFVAFIKMVEGQTGGG
jgi:hypothetical protein